MKVSSLLTQCSALLIDANNTRWDATDLLAYYNMALSAICSIDSSAYTVKAVKFLTSGTYQTLPSGANRLISITKNMGSSGSDAGRNVTLINREIFDRVYPGWAVDTSNEVVYHYMYDDNAPDFFYVYPANDGTGSVEMIYSAEPDECTDTDTPIPIKSHYTPAIQEYVMWRAFVKDSDNAASSSRAEIHKANFRELMGIGEASHQKTNPNLNSIPQMRKA